MASISLKNVSVSFPVHSNVDQSLKHKLLSSIVGSPINNQAGKYYVEALKNVSFNIKSGQRVAVVGHNGAGKSTLLKVIAGIYPPIEGNVSVSGNIQSVFDRHLGISMESSGWHNIETRGILYGLDKAQINELKLKVEELSGLGAYLNMPLTSYSAGMLMRLSFSIVTSLQQEILILDESIISGDSNFIAMAKQKVEELVDQTNILIMASHSMPLLNQFCNCGVLLEKGKATYYEDFQELIKVYSESRIQMVSK